MNLGRLCQVILESDKEISDYSQLPQHVIFAYHTGYGKLRSLHSPRYTFQILGGGRVGGLRMCHPPYHPPPLNFQGKVLNFCHPTLLKIRFKISVTPPPPPPLLEEGQSQNYGSSINFNGLLTLSGLLSLKFLLHNLFHQGEPC